MKISNIPLLIVSIAISQFAGVLGSIGTISSIPTWYLNLNKPIFNPPNYIFGPVWTILYTLMGISLYLVWLKGYHNPKIKKGVNFFLIHLVINTLWSLAFFGLRNPGVGLVVILVLWSMIWYLIKIFWPIDRRASWLLVPYFLWVSFATVLNFAIWWLN